MYYFENNLISTVDGGKITYELLPMNYDQLLGLWSILGANYQPSAVYKIRVLVVN